VGHADQGSASNAPTSGAIRDRGAGNSRDLNEELGGGARRGGLPLPVAYARAPSERGDFV